MAKLTRYHAGCTTRLQLAMAVLVAFVATSSIATNVRAQCVQMGTTVDCAGAVPGGFQAGVGEDNLDVTVQVGAALDNAGTGAAIAVNAGNSIVIEQSGAVTATGASSTGVSGSDSNDLINRGDVIVSGNDARGVGLGADSTFTNEATGRVIVSGGLVGANSVGVGANQNGTVANAGLIEVTGPNSVGIQTASGGTITNTGTIRLPDVNGAGVVLDNFTQAGGGSTLDNSGTIDASGDGGVGVRFDDTSATATNRGTISGGSGTGVGVLFNSVTPFLSRNTFTNESGGQVSAASGVAIRGASASDEVDNQGDVTGSIELEGGADVLGNSGTITGDVDLGAGQDSFDNSGTTVGNIVMGDGIDDLTNSGTITGNVDLGMGADRLDNPGTINGDVTLGSGDDRLFNAGTINGDVDLGDDDDLFDNLGVVIGNVDLGAGEQDELGIRTGSSLSGTLDGGVGGGDALRLLQATPGGSDGGSLDLSTTTNFEILSIGAPGGTDNGTWTLSGSGEFSTGAFVNTLGTAQFADGTTLLGPLVVDGGVARIGDGTSFSDSAVPSMSFPDEITVVRGSLIFEDGASSQAAEVAVNGGVVSAEGTASLTGNVTFGAGGGYGSTYSALGGSRLDVDGMVTIDPGATITATQTDSASIVQTFRVLTATQALSGEFVALPSSAFQMISTVYGPTMGPSFVDLSVASTFSLPASSPNERRVGQHLDAARGAAPSTEFNDFLSTLLTINDASTAEKALNSLHPEFYDVHSSASLSAGRNYARMLARRPLRCEQLISPYRRDQPSLAPCSKRGFTPWVQGFGQYSERDADSDYNDWHYGGGGLAGGVDHDLGEQVQLSAMVGTSRMALGFDDEGDGSLTTFEAGLGAAWHRDGTHVRGAIEYGHGWHRTRRQVDIPGFERLALSDHDSDRVTTLFEAGHTFVFGGFEIEPRASVDYTYLNEESARETNAGVVELDIDRRENSLVGTNAGFRAGMTLVKWYYAGDWLEWADGVWRPEISASWRQVWNDYDRDMKSSLSGAPGGTPELRTEAEDARIGADLGARVSFQPHGTRNTIELGYEAFVGERSISHGVMARIKIPL